MQLLVCRQLDLNLLPFSCANARSHAGSCLPDWRAAGQGAESMDKVSNMVQAIGAAEETECNITGRSSCTKHEMTDHSIARVVGVVHTCLRLLLLLLWPLLPVPPFCFGEAGGLL